MTKKKIRSTVCLICVCWSISTYGQSQDPISFTTDDTSFVSGFWFNLTGGGGSSGIETLSTPGGIPTLTIRLKSSGIGAAWVQGGNTFGTTGLLGTLDNNPLHILVNNRTLAQFTNSGADNAIVRLLANTTNPLANAGIEVDGGTAGRQYIELFRGGTRAAFFDVTGSGTIIAFGGAGTGDLQFYNESGTYLARMSDSDGRLSLFTSDTTHILNLGERPLSVSSKIRYRVESGVTGPAVWDAGVIDLAATPNTFEIRPITTDGKFIVYSLGYIPAFTVFTNTGDVEFPGDARLAISIGSTPGVYNATVGTPRPGTNNGNLSVYSDVSGFPQIDIYRGTDHWGRLTLDTSWNATRFDYRNGIVFYNLLTSAPRLVFSDISWVSLMRSYMLGEVGFNTVMQIGQGTSGADISTLRIRSGTLPAAESQVIFSRDITDVASIYTTGTGFQLGTLTATNVSVFTGSVVKLTLDANGRLLRVGKYMPSVQTFSTITDQSLVAGDCPAEVSAITFTYTQNATMASTFSVTGRIRNSSGGTRTFQVRLRQAGTSCASGTLVDNADIFWEGTATNNTAITYSVRFTSGISPTTVTDTYRVCICTTNVSGTQQSEYVSVYANEF